MLFSVFLLSGDPNSRATMNQMKIDIGNIESDKRALSPAEIMLDELSEKSVEITHNRTQAERWL